MKKFSKYFLFLLLLCVGILFHGKCSSAVTIKIATVTSDTLNVRTGPGTGYSNAKSSGESIVLKKGDQVTVHKVHGGWLEVSINYKSVSTPQKIVSLKGYISSAYVLVSSKEVKQYLPIKVKAKIRKKTIVYKSPGKKTKVSLKRGKKITIISEKTVKNAKWYKASFKYKKKTMKRWILEKLVQFNKGKIPGKITKKVFCDGVKLKAGTQVIIRKEKLVKNKRSLFIQTTYKGKLKKGYVLSKYVKLIKAEVKESGNPDGTNTILNDSQFEQEMTKQGFPESYKPYLRSLHQLYPKWRFQAFHTSMTWDTAVAGEAKPGICLVPNSKGSDWKSTAECDYDPITGKYHVYDGISWVGASVKTIRYYMDPRNFLNTQGIFQFELLSYQPAYQNMSGVQSILANTPFNTSLYSQAFMDAAAKSRVSPYHLATRVRQEVVTGTTTTTIAVTGTVVGYEGIYSFYNIGASDCINAVYRGLVFAKTVNETYLLPWNTESRAITGGALYIGEKFISKGQNTLYLQKFNVTQANTFSHQYMSNVEASYSEAVKMSNAYSTQMSSIPFIFAIPVYSSMPSLACERPVD